MEQLSSKQRAALERLAQGLSPVLILGQSGETDAFVQAADKALSDHELIKVKFNDHKVEIRAISEDLARRTGAVLVRVIGFTAIFFRQNEDKDKQKIHI